MPPRLFYTNLADLATLTASSADAEFPVANIQHSFRSKCWTSGIAIQIEYVQADMGAPVAVNAFIALDHDLLVTDTLIKIQGNTTSDFTSPAFSQTVTWTTGTLSALFSATQTYQYWRFTFKKTATATTRSIGRIFLGTYYQMTRSPVLSGIDFNQKDPSEKQQTLGQNTYVFVKKKFDSPSMKFQDILQAEMTQLETIGQLVGTAKNLFIQIDQDTAFDKLYYCKLVELPKKSFSKVLHGGTGTTFNTVLAFEEQVQ